MIKTRITEFFGVQRPIVQGGLMWIARSGSASAVANAGGMDFMTALTFEDPEELRAEAIIRVTFSQALERGANGGS